MVVPRVSARRLDFDVHASGEVELALVGADLELLARLLVDVRAAENRVTRDVRRKRDWPRHARAGALRGLDDVVGRLVEELVVECPEANADGRGGSHVLFLTR